MRFSALFSLYSTLYKLAEPILFGLPPEKAHSLTFRAFSAAHKLIPLPPLPAASILTNTIWGLDFANPVGSAAGFDKQGRMIDETFALGFGFAEIGAVTPLPQPGNPKPRLFHLRKDEAIINRMGFNSDGAAVVAQRIENWKLTCKQRLGPVGINLGVNKKSTDQIQDFVIGIKRFARLADFITINVSSPNTQGLRNLQAWDRLSELFQAAKQAAHEAILEGQKPPVLLLKIAPDLPRSEWDSIADFATRSGLIDGLIVCNTTLSRPAGLKSIDAREGGGLSGRPLFPMTCALVRYMAQATQGQIPIIGVGGISRGDDAYQLIRAGAWLVQLYTALCYKGPDLIVKINHDLAERLRADGFGSISAAIGADFDQPPATIATKLDSHSKIAAPDSIHSARIATTRSGARHASI